MEIFQVVAIAIVGTVLSLVLKKQNPEYGLYISLVTGIIIFYLVLSQLEVVINTLRELAEKTNLHQAYIKIIFKIIGIGYITEFASQICKDSGQGAIALKLEIAGKILIFVVSMPILITLIELLTKLLT